MSETFHLSLKYIGIGKQSSFKLQFLTLYDT